MKETPRQELSEFLRFCGSERRLAPATCAAYERDVSACLGYLQAEGVELADARVTHLRAFLAGERERRPAVASQARTTAALKCFFRFLVEEERLVRDPSLPLRTPKKPEALPDVLTLGELERLLALMAYGGLRRSELVGLDWDDVDLSRRLLRVRKAKGGRQRTIPIHPALAPLFAEYYATRVPLSEQAVFVGVQGKPLKYTQLGQTFRHYVEASGLDARKRVTPHTLRHVFASELLRAGANLRQIQELLGHKHLDSTQRYTRVNAHELRGAVKRLRWVGERPVPPATSEA
jgi:site-specific recombinase XerD